MSKKIDYTPRALSFEEVNDLYRRMREYGRKLEKIKETRPFDNNKYVIVEMEYYDLLNFINSCKDLTMAQFKKKKVDDGSKER